MESPGSALQSPQLRCDNCGAAMRALLCPGCCNAAFAATRDQLNLKQLESDRDQLKVNVEHKMHNKVSYLLESENGIC